ncbi:halocyanin domain-containing protein [Halorientalis halophila]|uniref:halocyanin domain-containing protein n=1 Tax=Halorientalis halophila TaxID=3108499 RepID=UPI00300A3CD5
MTVAGAVAGCSGGGNGDGDNGGTDGGGDDGDSGSGVSVPDEVDTYLSDNNARLYEGEAVDETGSDNVNIAVGAGSTNFAFDPPAVVVTPGTTITWRWTGNGGAHNVESADASDAEFRSGDAVDSGSETFEQTFDEPGNYLYYCFPHQGSGMHGAVIVQEE